MALPDVPDTYRVTLRQTNQGEELLNVFYYRDVAVAGPSAAGVAQGFWDKVKAAWRAVPTTTMSYIFNDVLAEQLFSPYGFFTYPIPLAEQTPTRVNAADPLPSLIAMTFKMNVATRLTRPGSKRISGWTEADTFGQNFVNAAVTIGQTLGALLDDTYTPTGAATTVTPVIVGYPTPLLPGAPRVQDITSVTVQQPISNQVSRKVGR